MFLWSFAARMGLVYLWFIYEKIPNTNLVGQLKNDQVLREATAVLNDLGDGQVHLGQSPEKGQQESGVSMSVEE